MSISVKRATGRDSSGRVQYSGYEKVGFKKRSSGGGYTRAEGGEISTEKGSLIKERTKEESQVLETQKQTPVETAPTTDSTAIASTVDPMGRPAVIRQTAYSGGFSTVYQGGAGYGTATYNKTDSVPIAGAQRIVQNKPQGKFESASKTQRIEMFTQSQYDAAKKTRNPLAFGRAVDNAFVGGLAISAVRTAQTAKAVVTRPKETAVATGAAIVAFGRSPIEKTTQGVTNIGASLSSNPARFAGIAAGDFATGSVVSKGLTKAGQTFRFAGMREIAAEPIVAPSYLSGKEFYPTGKPSAVVAEINANKRAFSAMPAAPNKGRTFTVLTQQEKKAAKLDSSETGGLYAADKISPAFTQAVVKGNQRPTITLVPRFGVPGSIASIETSATRLPAYVRNAMKRKNSIAPGNLYLEETLGRKGAKKAYSSPATELGVKPEAEVIIPGRSVIERKGDYGFVSRALGRDFDSFVRVPVSPGSKKTVPVAIREYKNLGFDGGFEGSSKVPKSRKKAFVSDVEYYRASKPGSAGILSYARTSPSISVTTSSFPSSSSYKPSKSSVFNFSSYAPSSSKVSRSSVTSYKPSSSRTSSSGYSSSGYGYSSSEVVKVPYTSSGSGSSSSRSVPFASSFFRAVDGGGFGSGKKRRDFKQTKRSDIYASSLTAGALRIRAKKGEKRSGGFLGIEVRGI